jgi:hypothetical protein
MDWKNLKAGKKAAEEQAPDPIHRTPEAPIISEDEAQIVENPDGGGPDLPLVEESPNDIRRQAGNSGNPRESGIRITPDETSQT